MLGGGGEDVKTHERLDLEEHFGGDLQAYAESRAGPATAEVRADPTHPWHQRKRCAIALIDMTDDSVSPPHLRPLFTRTEICAMFKMSDSALGKLGVPPVRKSGRWSLYDPADVLDYRSVRAYRDGYRKASGEPPAGTVHQLAARIRADVMTEHGPPPPTYMPPEETR